MIEYLYPEAMLAKVAFNQFINEPNLMSKYPAMKPCPPKA